MSFEKCRIHVLSSMGNKVHHHQQNRQINEQLPMRNDAAAKLSPVFMLGFFPNFRLFNLESNKKRQQRRQPANEEERPPAPTWKNEEIAEGGEQITGCVTFLEQAGKYA